MSTVLVTGGSGFIGSHCIVQLLAAGHRVRTTLRDLERRPNVLAALGIAGADLDDKLSFFPADLDADAGWQAAATGCEYVLHVASPFPSGPPRRADELILPAREGTLRVLRAARAAGVKRIVVTSSFAAVGYGHPPQARPFDETQWTNLESRGVVAYAKSKTLAERAAWEFVAREGAGLELAVINPVAVFGPALGPNLSTSVLIIKMMMDGAMPGYPRLSFGIVDVRDVAALHILAMTHPNAAGERFLAVAGDFMWLDEIAKLLKARMGELAQRVNTRQIPDWAVRLIAVFDRRARQALPELGHPKSASNAKARELLGWSPRSNEESILATAESLVRLGLTAPYRGATATRA